LRKLSELEGVCLGLVVKFQHCTAYQVRRALKESPSTHWQASAGSVYPLLKRFEGAGLVTATIDHDDGRGRKLLRATAVGRQALKKWIISGTQPELVSAIMDPARSRMFFLDVLSPKQRIGYISELIGKMEQHLEDTRLRLALTPESKDQFGHFGALAAVRMTQTRLDWLKHVKDRLS
jgi:DNA-binding PadR family transcriptional regulator